MLDPAHAPGAPAAVPVHLNTHIDYSSCCDKDESEHAKSFAFPTAGVLSADGSRFFFSALGSDKIGSVSVAAVGAGFDPFFLPESVLGARLGGFFAQDAAYTGAQVRGFGFLHDGGVDTMHRFHGANAFERGGGNEDALDPVLPRDADRLPA